MKIFYAVQNCGMDNVVRFFNDERAYALFMEKADKKAMLGDTGEFAIAGITNVKFLSLNDVYQMDLNHETFG